MTDYPQDIMHAAEEALDNLLCNCRESCGGTEGLRLASIKDIAKTIMAERERCAMIADVVASGFGHDEYDQGRRDGAAFIAEAIRGGLGDAPDRLEEIGFVEKAGDHLNISIDDDLTWAESEKLYRKVKS